jgi:hypothetical protein
MASVSSRQRIVIVINAFIAVIVGRADCHERCN